MKKIKLVNVKLRLPTSLLDEIRKTANRLDVDYKDLIKLYLDLELKADKSSCNISKYLSLQNPENLKQVKRKIIWSA